MKRSCLADVIMKHGRRIKKYGDQLPGSFEAAMIHDLRLEYKKLRAFIRLLQMDESARHLSIAPAIKTVYQAAGQVRDLQLFLPQIEARSAVIQQPLHQFTRQLQQQLFQAKEILVSSIERLKAGKAIGQITNELPHSLKDVVIRKFIHRKVAAVNVILLALEKDRELHTIRKQLKDIIYNIRLFDTDWGKPFPVTAWRSEKRLQDTAAALGDFNDRCNAVSFLSTKSTDPLPGVEQQVLYAWREELLQEKEAWRLKVLEQLSQLQLVSNFEQSAT